LLLLSIIFVLSSGLFLSSLFRTTSRVSYLVAVYLFTTVNIVVNSFMAHFFHQLNSTCFFLGFEFFTLLVSYLAWSHSNKPPFLGPWKLDRGLFKADWLRFSSRKWPAIWVLGASVFVIYIFGVGLILLVPPNTNDILTTHLTRVAFWMQHGDFLRWSTPNTFNLIYPINSNLLMLWMMLFSRSWLAAGLIQWSASLVGGAAIYGISLQLGWGRPGAFFAGLIWLSLPEILLQSTTTQLDLIVAVFSVIAVYFLIAGFRNQVWQELVLSGLAIGLAVGTKQIALFLLPGFALFTLIIWLKDRKSFSRKAVIWVISSSICLIVFGSYIYFQNLILFQNPLGDADTLSHQVGAQKDWGIRSNLTYNSVRFIYQSLDPSGVPFQFADNFTSLKSGLFKPILSSIGLNLEDPVAVHDPDVLFSYGEISPIQEDRSWYGLLGFGLVFLLTPVQFVLGIKKKDPYRFGLVSLVLIYAVLVLALRPGWDPYQGRYFIPVVALTSPFLAFLIRPGLGWRVLVWIMVVFATLSMVYTTLVNQGKPLVSYPRLQSILIPDSVQVTELARNQLMTFAQVNFPAQRDIWDLDMTGRQLIQNSAMVKPVRMVEEFVPADATLALGFTRNLPVLPFFGHRPTRRIYQVFPPETLLDKSWFQDNQIDFLLLHLPDPKMPMPPGWLILYQTSGEWALYYPEWNVPSTP
jgi:hypothetical protein